MATEILSFSFCLNCCFQLDRTAHAVHPSHFSQGAPASSFEVGGKSVRESAFPDKFKGRKRELTHQQSNVDCCHNFILKNSESSEF